MSETLETVATSVDVNPKQLTAAILFRLSGRPETYLGLSHRYGVTIYVLSSSSEHLNQSGIIRFEKGKGYVAGKTNIVRLVPFQGGKNANLPKGTEVQILLKVFGQGRRFVIDETYDLQELVAEAKQYASTSAELHTETK